MLFKKQFLRVLLNIDSFIIVYFLKNNIFVSLLKIDWSVIAYNIFSYKIYLCEENEHYIEIYLQLR